MNNRAILENGNLRYHCPGCNRDHCVPAERWHFNGDLEFPTLSPSVKHFTPAGTNRPEKTICHYFIRAGFIEFCSDCQHDLKGQKVELPPIEKAE